MNVKSLLANEKYNYSVQFYPVSLEDEVKEIFNQSMTTAVAVPLNHISLETQQLDEAHKEKTVQDLIEQINEIQENKKDTGHPIGFIVDASKVGTNHNETESTLIAAAHTAISDSTSEVAVALIPLDEQDIENEHEEHVDKEVIETLKDCQEYGQSLESLGCKVYTSKSDYLRFLNSL